MDFASDLFNLWCGMWPFFVAAAAAMAIGAWLRRIIRGERPTPPSHTYQRPSSHTPSQAALPPPPQSPTTKPSESSSSSDDDYKLSWEEREAEREKAKEAWENSLTKAIIDFLRD